MYIMKDTKATFSHWTVSYKNYGKHGVHNQIATLSVIHEEPGQKPSIAKKNVLLHQNAMPFQHLP